MEKKIIIVLTLVWIILISREMKESGYTIKDLITSDKEMQQDVMNAQEVRIDTIRVLD
jgi:hypothetical protein|tara:strand:+ start:6439 stop:6612 length:174 start_codon:yes stop_codon:yes gene_type:complete